MRKLNEEYGLVDDIGCLGAVADNLMGKATSNRADALTYKTDKLFVDTCYCLDTDYWETAIEDKRYNDYMIIVEEYDNEESAKVGHKKWLEKMLSDDLPLYLKSIQDGDKYKLKENKK